RALPDVTDGLHDRLEVLELARAEGDVGARPRELDRDGFAYSRTASRDDRGLALERKRRFGHGAHATPGVPPCPLGRSGRQPPGTNRAAGVSFYVKCPHGKKRPGTAFSDSRPTSCRTSAISIARRCAWPATPPRPRI